MWQYFKYKTSTISKLFIFFSFLVPQASNAQDINDFESWTNIGVAYPLTKKTDLCFKYILGLDDNSTTFKRSMFSLQLDQKINKWLKIGSEYRYATSYVQDVNRFWLYAIVDKSLTKKWELSYRKLFQYDVIYFDQEYMSEKPSWLVDRNMLKLKYHYNKRITPYVYVDIYSQIKRQEYIPYRFRAGLGANYLFKKRHDFGAEYVVIEEFNVKKPWNIGFVNLKYIYNIPKFNKQPKIKKGKKKHNQ